MRYKVREEGFAIIPALFVILVLIIVGTTFLAFVRSQQKPVLHEQASITAKYAAETGLQKTISELASLSNMYTHAVLTNPTRTSNPITLRTDTSGSKKVETSYTVKIEDGSKLSGKTFTVTGSTTEGSDKYGNPIWFNATNKNFDPKRNMHRFGIEVRGYTTELWETRITKKTGMGVYAVIEIPAPTAGTSEIQEPPAKYLLSSNSDLKLLSSAKWYGPLHTNSQLQFQWVGAFDPDGWGDIDITVPRGTPANTADEAKDITTGASFPGVTVKQGGTTYIAGSDYYIEYSSGAWFINWAFTGRPEPLANTAYTIEYGYPDPIKDAKMKETIVRSSTANGTDNFRYIYEPIVKQGMYTYTSPKDYCFAPWGNPQKVYIDWSPTAAAGGAEPVIGSQYKVTYKPHNPIEIYGPTSYAGSAPSLRYFHEHKAIGGSWPRYRASHGHAGLWGVDFLTNDVDNGQDYRALSKKHYHTLSTSAITAPGTPDTYFTWGNNSYKPLAGQLKNPPVIAPNNVNYYRQREQLNRYMQIAMKNNVMPRDASGNLGLPNPAPTSCCPGTFPGGCTDGACPSANPVSCPERGYFDMAGGTKDFRCYYFGNNLKYSAGGLSGQKVPFCYYAVPPVIWVNDNGSSADYMKVASTRLTTDYHYYNYFEIPKNGTILDTNGSGATFASGLIIVKDGVVKIGNYKPKSPSINCADCVTLDVAGNSTIIDGSLTIVSYTEAKPTDYTAYNKGDIITIGNVLYRNGLYTNDNINWKQYDPPGIQPTNYTATNVTWITNTDGSIITRTTNGRVEPVGQVNGLSLIASNDIKFPTTPYWTAGGDTTYDVPQINGQLIAGHSVSQCQTSNESNQDLFIFYGSMYSYETPLFDYFNTARYYFLDRSLFMIPPLGEPFFPQDSTYKSQHIAGTSLIDILPGTWREVPAP